MTLWRHEKNKLSASANTVVLLTAESQSNWLPLAYLLLADSQSGLFPQLFLRATDIIRRSILP
jgi:hypothetical protein